MNDAAKKVVDTYKHQRTFVLLKPDAVLRGLIGKVISEFEQRGLKIVSMKMIQATAEQVENHYPIHDEKWLTRLWGKSLSGFEWIDADAGACLGSDDPLVLWKEVAEAFVGYFNSWPSIAMIIEGIQAVDMVRKIVGHTLPVKAAVWTIREKYSVDTPLIANLEKRIIHNLIHASETAAEALDEIKVRFGGEPEIFSYKLSSEDVAYNNYY